MKTSFLVTFLLLWSFPYTFAQIEDLLADPNITWIGETELEYDLEPEYLIGSGNPKMDRYYECRVRKNDFNDCNNYYDVISDIGDAIAAGKLLAYDKKDGRKLTKEEISQRFILGLDSLTTFDLETQEERIKIVTICEPAISFIRTLRVKKVWYYNRKIRQFANRVIGVSFMMPVYDEKKDSILKEKGVLMYVAFPMRNQKELHINMPQVPFCMETTEYVEIDSFKTLKGNLNKTFEQFFFQLPKNKAIETYSRESSSCCNQLIDKEEYQYIFNASLDSINLFNHHDYREPVKVAKRPVLEFEDYSKKYKVVQTWYFDATTNQLVSKLDAVAPAKDEFDDNGNFLYTVPLFYLCFRKKAK